MSYNNNSGVRPIIAPHYHCDNSLVYNQYMNYDNYDHRYNTSYYPTINQFDQRYNTYDPITGEYRRSGVHNPYVVRYMSGGQYLRERRPILCCAFCRKKIPVNCLTISLIVSLMLLMMFSFIHLIVDANTTKTAINSDLLLEMIWIMILSCAQHFISSNNPLFIL